jgi:general stress protein 26
MESDFKKLAELIKGIKIAMMATVDVDGTIHSRPMATQEHEFDGELWFFTSATSHKVDEVQRNHQICLAYADPSDQRYVSVSGAAELVRDRNKAQEYWNPVYKTWFPKGLDDPDLALLRVTVQKAEYWDTPSGTMVQLAGFVQSVVTGKRYEGGEHGKLTVP